MSFSATDIQKSKQIRMVYGRNTKSKNVCKGSKARFFFFSLPCHMACEILVP